MLTMLTLLLMLLKLAHSYKCSAKNGNPVSEQSLEPQKRAILVVTKEVIVKGITKSIKEETTLLKFAWRYSDAEEEEINLAFDKKECSSNHLKWYLFDPIEEMNEKDITDEKRKELLEEVGKFIWNLLPPKIMECFNTFHGTSGLTILCEAGIPWELARIPQKKNYVGNLYSVGRTHLVEGIFCQSQPPSLGSHISLLVIAPTYDPLEEPSRRKIRRKPREQVATTANDLQSRKWDGTIRGAIRDFEGLGTRVSLECSRRLERKARHGILRTVDEIEAASKKSVCTKLREENTIVLYLGHSALPETQMGLKLIGNDYLTVTDIEALITQQIPPPCLVLLMACSAGAAGHLELVDALVKWGVRAVVATNWDVDDNTATDFVKHLFGRLRENSYYSIGQIFHQAVEDMAGKGDESRLAFALYGSPLLNMPWNQSPRLELNLWSGILDMSPDLLPSLTRSRPPGLRVNTEGLSLKELEKRFEQSEEGDTKVVSAMPLLLAIELLNKQRSKGKDLRIVGLMFDPNTESVQIITRKGRKDIKTPADLEGKRVAVNGLDMVPTLVTAASIVSGLGYQVKVTQHVNQRVEGSSVSFVNFLCHDDAVAALDRNEADAAVVYWNHLGDYNPRRHKIIAAPVEYFTNHGMKVIGQVLLTRKEDYDGHEKDFKALIKLLNEQVISAFDAQNQKGINNVGIFIQNEDVRGISRFVERIVELKNNIAPGSRQLRMPAEMAKVFITKRQFKGLYYEAAVRTPHTPEDIAKRIVECLEKNLHRGEHGLLLYGSSNIGKTRLAKDAAEIAQKLYDKLEIRNLEKGEGESEDSFQHRFQDVLDSRFQEPTVVIINETESVLGETSPGAAHFKIRTDSKGERMVYYLATTNYPEHLSAGVIPDDPNRELRRLSQFWVGYPDQAERRRAIRYEFQKQGLPSDEKVIEHFAQKSGLRNYADIVAICARLVDRRGEGITKGLIDKLLKEVKAVDPEELRKELERRNDIKSVDI
jgi:hypothetical protein